MQVDPVQQRPRDLVAIVDDLIAAAAAVGLGIAQVTHIASLNGTGSYFESYTNLLAPFGKIAMIDDPGEPLDVMKLKFKSQSLHIEFMFARSMFNAADMDEQSKLLNRVADLVDQGYIQTTEGKNLGTINAKTLKAAHEELESGKAIGKIVLEGLGIPMWEMVREPRRLS